MRRAGPSVETEVAEMGTLLVGSCCASAGGGARSAGSSSCAITRLRRSAGVSRPRLGCTRSRRSGSSIRNRQLTKHQPITTTYCIPRRNDMRNRDPVKESNPRCRVSALQSVPPLRLGSGKREPRASRALWSWSRLDMWIGLFL